MARLKLVGASSEGPGVLAVSGVLSVGAVPRDAPGVEPVPALVGLADALAGAAVGPIGIVAAGEALVAAAVGAQHSLADISQGHMLAPALGDVCR